MKTIKKIMLALLIAAVSVTVAHAGTQVLKNEQTTVTASVKNISYGTMAAVKMTGYDDAGGKVGQLCKEVYLRGYGRTTDVDFNWQAPGYATGIYWQAKVEKRGECPNSDPVYDDHEHDDDEHDDDEHDDDEHEHDD